MPRWAAGLVLAGLMAAGWIVERRKPRASGPAPRSRPNVAAGKPHTLLQRVARPSWREGKEIARRVYKALGDDRLLAVAAGIVFYGLLTFFPAITALVSIYGLLADPATIREHLSLVEIGRASCRERV